MMYLSNREVALLALTGLSTELEEIIQKTSKQLEDVPQGRIKVSAKYHSFYFHHILENGQQVYLQKNQNKDLIIGLIRKQYNTKVLKAAEKEKMIVENFLSKFPKKSISDLYTEFSEIRKRTVIPVVKPLTEIISDWVAIPYTSSSLYEEDKRFETQKGDYVRSKSEVFIANELLAHGLAYKYECSMFIDETLIHPDFIIFNPKTCQEVYWEHFGMVDTPNYAIKAFQRIMLYQKNGIYLGKQLIITCETGSIPLTISVIRKHIKEYFG